RRVFELAAGGALSTKDLADEAWRLGLRGRGGKKVGKPALHAILRHPLYKGDVRFDGVVARGTHEPIVDAGLWERVQRALSGRRTCAARPQDLTLRDLFVFGSLLKCPGCGRRLCPYRAKGRYVYYE